MKLSIRQICTAVLLALLGAGNLAVSAEDFSDSKAQTEATPTLEDAKKAAANKKPRGLLADSFFWPSGTDNSASRSSSQSPAPAPIVSPAQAASERSRSTSQRTLAAAEKPAVFLSEPVFNPPPPPIVEAQPPLIQPQPVVQAQPVVQPQPVVQAQPVVQTQTVVQAVMPPQAQPAPQPQYAMQTQPVVQAQPQYAAQPQYTAQPQMAQPQYAAQPQYVAQAQPIMQAQPAIQSQPMLQQQPVMQQQTIQQQPMLQQQFVQSQPVAQAQPQFQSVAFSTFNGPEQQIMQQAPQYVQAPISEGYTCSCSDTETCTDCCPDPLCCHRCGVFGDFLYLRPGNIDYVYAVEQTGTLPTDVPTGPVGRVGFDMMPGYRIGFNQCLCDSASIQFAYTNFQASTSNSITAEGINVLIFQPGMPQIPNVGASSITSSADYAIRFQKIDIDYRALLYGDCDTAVNWFAGLRYANLEQNFRAEQDVGVLVGLSQVRTDINFDGFGIGMGLDGMIRRPGTGWLMYGNASANFYSGEVKADYRQTTQFGPNSVIGNTLDDYRVITVLHTELGMGWRSCCGRVQLTAGYQFEGWFNTLTTGSYIPGVQGREYSELHEPISFDGLVARALVQF